ncbi:hypothetical protein CsSME_00014520 [Camellia sinensis var. sinensis]
MAMSNSIFSFLLFLCPSLLIMTRANLPGTWEVVVANAGIASMHAAVTRFNTVVLLDRTNIGPSRKMLRKATAATTRTTPCSNTIATRTPCSSTSTPLKSAPSPSSQTPGAPQASSFPTTLSSNPAATSTETTFTVMEPETRQAGVPRRHRPIDPKTEYKTMTKESG